MSVLIHLCLTFGMLSLLAVGGGTAVIPEMQTVLKSSFNIDHTTFIISFKCIVGNTTE